jgi:hypothetical protein
MATIQIILRDTDDGLVDVETTVHQGWKNTAAVQLAGRIADFLDEIAKPQGPTVSRDGAEVIEATQAA